MGLSQERDLDELRAGLERWLDRPVGNLVRPAPGYSCETLIVDDELVVRLPPVGDGIFPTYDLAQQAAAQDAIGAAGVPVAAPVRYEADPSFLGAPFASMPFVAGRIPNDFTPADEWLRDLPSDDARHDVWRSFVEVVVGVHGAAVDGLGLRTGLAAELAFWDEYIGWATDGNAPVALRDALAWCQENRPTAEASGGLLWGDVRLGNVIFDETTHTPRAVLDFDMVSVGPAEMDVAWFLALEQVQTDLTSMRVPGFGTRDDAIALVEARLGRPLSDLAWHEVFALVRASAISTRIAVLFARNGQKSMFKVGQDPTIVAAVARIDAW